MLLMSTSLVDQNGSFANSQIKTNLDFFETRIQSRAHPLYLVKTDADMGLRGPWTGGYDLLGWTVTMH